MKRLNKATLHSLPASIKVPAYAPNEFACGIVHLGTGAFHRAHQAVYTDAALASSGGDWRIIGSSLRSRSTADQMARQNNLYTVVSRDIDAELIRIIGSIDRIIFAPDDPSALISAIGDSQCKVVTLTITEKGYCYDFAESGLDFGNQLVQADLRNPDTPRSAPGFLVAGLQLRKEQEAGPVSLLSCDNLPNNGTVLRTIVLQMADAVDASLASWIEENVSFPSSMVDRIVPATTKHGRQYVATRLGVADDCPVLTESFSQWVLEDRFAAGRPAWEDGGATFVADVEPFEKMKLRLLNGSHSTIAYLGFVAGIRFVHEFVADRSFRRFLQLLMNREVTPTLDTPDFDLDGYKRQLLRRFANPSLNHETRQIAMDGSQKLPQRLLNPIRDRLKADQPIDCLVLAVAAWMRYVGGADESGLRIEISDPIADRLEVIRDEHNGHASGLVPALLSIGSIFGDDLPRDVRFVEPVTLALTQLFEFGVLPTVNATIERLNPADR